MDVNPKDGLKILLVDDFELVRMMLRNSLKELGFNNVYDASDGKSALHKLQEAVSEGSPYHVVFCDWNMPNMNGMELLEHCRKIPDLANLDFIMVSAEADQKQVFKALQNGASDYIIKPITHGILDKKVHKILKKFQIQASNVSS